MDRAVQDTPARDYSFLEGARRLSRFKAARERVQRIAETEPRFTAGELIELAAIFISAAARGEPAGKSPSHTCGETGYTSKDICIACHAAAAAS